MSEHVRGCTIHNSKKCGNDPNVMKYHSAIKRNEVLYNLDEPQKHCTKRKKPDAKDQMCNSIYMKCPEKVNPQRQKVFSRAWGEGRMLMGTGLLLE